MIKILILGISGKMGRMIYSQLKKSTTSKAIAGVDNYADVSGIEVPVFPSLKDCALLPDVIIDFSRPESLTDILDYSTKNKIPVVIATTGYSKAQSQAILDAANIIPIFMASNMSLGVNLMMSLSRQAASFLGAGFDVEIIEQHHNQKVDSPSGTALSLANAINNVFSDHKEFCYGRHSNTSCRNQKEIGIHAIRGGTIVGKHDVMFIGNDEIITLSHEAQSRQAFALGAIRAAEFIATKPPKLYSMNHLLGIDYPVTNVTREDGIAVFSIAKTTTDEYIKLFDEFAKTNINIDMISQTTCCTKTVSVSFTMNDKKAPLAKNVLDKFDIKYSCVSHTVKLTCEGIGMQYKSGVFKEVVSILNNSGTKIHAITTSETKIACCIDNSHASNAVKLLSDYFIK